MQSPNHRATQLIQSLINISKVSTPARKRIVQPSSYPMNSTPVNTIKIPQKVQISSKQKESYPNKFGSNTKPTAMKQNMQANLLINNYQSQPVKGQKGTSLSPIMAFNTKIKEGKNKNEQYQQSPYKFSRSNSKFRPESEEIKQKNSYSTILNSKNHSQMQSSNSFKNLLESKNKTTQGTSSLAFGNLNKKQNEEQIKSSRGGRTFNRLQLGQKQIQQNKCDGFANTFLKNFHVQQRTILCMNEDGKKAKYKVIKKGSQLDDDLLIYCSRCAIGVVQQGFSVQEITNQDYQQMFSLQPELKNPKCRSLSPMNDIFVYTNRIKESIASKIHQLNSQKIQFQQLFKKELDNVDCYYNSIIEIIEQQRVRDRQSLLFIRDQLKKQPEQYETNLLQGIKHIEQIITSGNIKTKTNFKNELKTFENYLLANIEYPKNLTPINSSIQQCFDNFSLLFENEIKLRIGMKHQFVEESQIETQIKKPLLKNLQSVNQASKQSPLRFSFEKIVEDQIKQQKNERRPLAPVLHYQKKTLQSVQQEHESGLMQSINNISQIQHNKKVAFRNLFPEDQQQLQYQKMDELQKPIKSPTFKQF